MSKIWGFERQPYLRELEVEILEVDEISGRWWVRLDDTILYPEGGGQPSDRGRLNDVEVEWVETSPSGLRHALSGPIERGTARLTLDWQRRYTHMQQHTAQHLLTRCALDTMGWQTRSFHIGPDVSDIELDCPPPDLTAIAALEEVVASVIAQARPIRAYRVSPQEYQTLEVRSRGLPSGHQGDVRLVEIQEFDLNTCGGTHLASTAEVETLKVVGTEPLRGGCRLFWVAGQRVRQRLAMQDRRMASLRKTLDSADDQIVGIVRSKLEQLQQARRDGRWLLDRLAALQVDGLVKGVGPTADLHLEGVESSLLRPLAEHWQTCATDKVALLTSETENGASFVVVKGQECPLDLQDVGRSIAELLGGRGGGSGSIFQGKTETLSKRREAVEYLRRICD